MKRYLLQSLGHQRPLQFFRNILAPFVISGCLLLGTSAAQGFDEDEGPSSPRRRGWWIGIDPGLVLLWSDENAPLYARIPLRLGYCITDWFHLGADFRYDILVTIERENGVPSSQRRFGLGATFFLVDGWFARPSGLLNISETIFISAGLQTGYEFRFDKFAGIGFAVSTDYEHPVREPFGEESPAWVFGVALYLTAYDLGERLGRDEGAP